MKKLFIIAVFALTAAGICSAQRASEYDLGKSTDTPSGYNRIGVSYNNTSYSPNSDAKEYIDGFSTNGVGIDYIHGFSISKSLPMFIETGANINFNFYGDSGSDWKQNYQNFNIQVPVNYVYRFALNDDFSIAPYLGLNFKVNLLSREKYDEYDDYNEEWESSGWESLYDKDVMGDDGTFNRFQMGWHVGVGVQYSKFHFGLQYGTDFIPAFKHSEGGYKPAINNGNLKLTLSYCF